MTSFRLYLVKRLGYIAVTLSLISFIVFFVTQMLPGNAAVMILGKQATPEKVAALEQQLGLNRPWYVQYADWVGDFVTGDWGRSFISDQPVAKIIETRVTRSLQLALIALVGVILVGIPLGVLAALKRDTWWDITISIGSYIGISFPEFVTGAFAILLLGGPIFDVFPSGGYAEMSEGIIPWLMHLALPSIVMTIMLLAHIMRLTRSEMIDVLQSDYVRTARLKGLREPVVLVKHSLRNGLLPTITLLALDFGFLLGGMVIIEEIFTYPGLGKLIVFAIKNRDLPTLQIAVLIVAIAYTMVNFLADIVYTKLDPRIEYGES